MKYAVLCRARGAIGIFEWRAVEAPSADQARNLSGDAPNVIDAPIVGGGERTAHATQKPETLYRAFIKASSNPGDLVCDFMAGSGTCGVAARALRRRFVLVEREPSNVTIIRARMVRAHDAAEEPAG